MTGEPIRICYQSYVDEEHGADYWHYLRDRLSDIASPGTTVDIVGITPHDGVKVEFLVLVIEVKQTSFD